MPGGKGNIKGSDNTNGFQKNPQNINKSGLNRKSFSLFNKICKENGVEKLSKKEYLKSLSYLFSLNEDEIQVIAKDKEQPLALRLMIAELTDSSTRGKMLKDLRDYLFSEGEQVFKVELKTDIPEWMNYEPKTKS
jgi:hypothetical protein